METINKEFEKFKCFNFKKVNYKGLDYLTLEPITFNYNIFKNKPINKFELEIAPFIKLYLKLLNNFDRDVRTIFKEEKFFLDEKNKKVNVIVRHFKNIRSSAKKTNIDFNLPIEKGYYLSYYLISDLIYEIIQRITILQNLNYEAKPYLRSKKTILEVANSFEIFQITSKLSEIENLKISEWLGISQNRIIHNDTFYSLNILNDNFCFDNVIKPKAKDDFEKWYKTFCIDDPEIDKLDVILYFKLMNKKGYFIIELDIEQLHKVTIDRTKRQISFNYFKNNGRRKFEDWLDGKPNVPIFKSSN